MAARAIYKAVLLFGDVRLPVKFYAALVDRNIHFNLLHDQDEVRLKQQMIHPETGEAVPYEEIRRGFEIEPGMLVLLGDEELESLDPEPTRDVEVSRFVDPAKINHQWYDRPYYLGPDGDEESYFALAEALAQQEVEGVARWVMRKKEYVGALRAVGGYLMLITLRYADEVIPVDALEPPEGRPLEKKERAMAEQLVAALADEFDPSDYRDEYRHRVSQLIEVKRRGGTIELEEFEEQPEPESLEKALQESLDALGEE